MRLAELQIEGFRGFAGAYRFDLDADAVVVVGVNGSGKTSLLDAVLWALTGRLARLESVGGSVRSGYVPTGETRVALVLRNQHRRVEVVRSQIPDEKPSRLMVDLGEGPRRGVAAEVALLEAVWPPGLDANDAPTAMTSALSRSVYLQQDLVRQFVEADTDRDRFDVLSELVGAGRIRELYEQLEKAKRAWTSATNELGKELEPLSARLDRLQALLERSTDVNDLEQGAGWSAWWERARALGVNVAADDSPAASAASQLDAATRQIDVLVSRLNRSLTVLDEVQRARALMPPTPSAHEVHALEATHRAAAAEVEVARERLRGAQERAAARDRERRLERDRDRQLAELARLALNHLGERCPVCTQTYDREDAIEHLRALIARVDIASPRDVEDERGLLALEAEASAARAGLEEVAEKLEMHNVARARAEAATAEHERRLSEIGIDVSVDDEELQRVDRSYRAQLAELSRLHDDGERLALSIARRAQNARRGELAREAEEIDQRRRSLEADMLDRNLTGELAQQFLESIRAAAADVVGLQLRHLEPLLARFYARIDPHPALRQISMRSWTERGRGRLRTRLSDPVSEFETDLPATVLSSSQLNALAVATFLALNLGVAQVPLQTAMLDDPLQSLDDVNLLGLVDLLRRVKERRQLLVTTHDGRFGDLLERKLRALDGQRTIRIDLSGWTRNGPVVSQHDVPPERRLLQLVA
jgi:AAA domain